MKLKVNSEDAIRLLRNRITALTSPDYDPKVWKDRAVMDVKAIFTSTEWLQVSNLTLDTLVTSNKEQVRCDGKITAERQLESFIQFIQEHDDIEQAVKQETEVTFEKKYRNLLNKWNDFVPRYNKMLAEHEEYELKKAKFDAQVKNNTLPAGTIKILFLGANPDDQTRLRVDKEVREIDAGLRRANERETFALHQRWAVSPHDIQQALLDFDPDIVHFSGHGDIQGIVAEESHGQSQLVTNEALSELFSLFAEKMRCVILNSCFSASQATEIAKYIPYVVGMNSTINDDTAINFSLGFYAALGAGKDLEFAFKMGLVSIKLTGLAGADIPQLIKNS